MTDDTDRNVVASGACYTASSPVLDAGTYRLVLTSPGELTGTYALQLLAPAPQVFSLGTLGSAAVSVSNVVPAAGAGNLETNASEDDYTFGLPSAGSVMVDIATCPADQGLTWQLIAASDGSVVSNGNGCTGTVVTGLDGGTYRLVVTPQSFVTGTYSLQVQVVPAPQVFQLGALTTATTVSPGVPAAGAGTLETKASEDQYRFSIATGRSVFVDFTDDSTSSQDWRLVTDDAAQAVIGTGTGDARVPGVTPGSYRFIVGHGDSLSVPGTYTVTFGPNRITLTVTDPSEWTSVITKTVTPS